MADDLTYEECQALVNLLTFEIEASKFPLSPRIEALKRISAKLREEEPPATALHAGATKRKPRQ